MKTTISRELSRRLGATYFRIDVIEQALWNAAVLTGDVGPAGYEVANALAACNLAVGRTVVADCVNPVAESRAGWGLLRSALHRSWSRSKLPALTPSSIGVGLRHASLIFLVYRRKHDNQSWPIISSHGAIHTLSLIPLAHGGGGDHGRGGSYHNGAGSVLTAAQTDDEILRAMITRSIQRSQQPARQTAAALVRLCDGAMAKGRRRQIC